MLRDWKVEAQAQAIYDMRSGIRDKHHDIRTRQDIIRDLWTMVEEFSDHAEPASNASKKVRKRQDPQDIDLDEDYRPKKQGRRK